MILATGASTIIIDTARGNLDLWPSEAIVVLHWEFQTYTRSRSTWTLG